MPFTPLSVAVLVCEKVLQESQSILSAIRIVDVFFVSQDAPEGSVIPVEVIFVAKAYFTDETYRVSLQHEQPDGTVEDLLAQEGVRMQQKFEDAQIPSGLNANFKLLVDLAYSALTMYGF